MSSYAIVLVPVIPVREVAREQAQQVTQLLFGECVEVITREGLWAEVVNVADGYQGWVSYKMLTHISKEEFDALQVAPTFYLRQPFVHIYAKNSTYPLRLSVGSFLPGYDPKSQLLVLAGKTFHLPRTAAYRSEQVRIKEILRTATYLIHTPYLWGGKNLLGIDCSGFVQLVYRIHAIHLPRDASQQIHLGDSVDLEHVRPGDLAFFSNEQGRVTHVGIVYTPTQILHASGEVRIDRLDAEGIYNQDLAEYTHTRLQLKRVVE